MTLPWSPALLDLAHSPAGLSASYIDSLLPAAARLGLDIQALLNEVGLDLNQLRDPRYRLPLFKAFDLLLRAEQQTGDALLAPRLAQQVQPRSFQLLGYMCISCATLGEAIQRLHRFEALVWDIGHTELLDEGERLALTWQAPDLAWLPPRGWRWPSAAGSPWVVNSARRRGRARACRCSSVTVWPPITSTTARY